MSQNFPCMSSLITTGQSGLVSSTSVAKHSISVDLIQTFWMWVSVSDIQAQVFMSLDSLNVTFFIHSIRIKFHLEVSKSGIFCRGASSPTAGAPDLCMAGGVRWCLQVVICIQWIHLSFSLECYRQLSISKYGFGSISFSTIHFTNVCLKGSVLCLKLDKALFFQLRT